MLKKRAFLHIVTGVLTLVIGSGLLFGARNIIKPDVKGVKTAATATPKPQVAILEIFSQPVGVKLPGQTKFSTAKEKMIIPQGTIIKTGDEGRAQIVFPGGTVTRIDHESMIRVKQFEPDPQNIFIEILEGRIWNRIKKLFGNESFQSSGGTMIATVRGTSYGHGLLDGDYNRGSVLKGIVQLECFDKSNIATLSANMKGEVNCTMGSGFEEEDVSEIDKSDEWVQFNADQDKKLDERFGKDTYEEDDEVLGTSISSTPIPTIKHGYPTYTPKPTNSNGGNNNPNPTNTNAPAATHTSAPPTYTPEPPKPTDTPIPVPVVIKGVSAGGIVEQLIGAGILQSAVITVDGDNLDGASISMSDAENPQIRSQSVNQIVTLFTNVKCGGHTVTVSKNGATATGSVNIQPLICISLR